MKLLHTGYAVDRKANIFHNDHCYVVELYIGDRLFRKMNVMETLVDAKIWLKYF